MFALYLDEGLRVAKKLKPKLKFDEGKESSHNATVWMQEYIEFSKPVELVRAPIPACQFQGPKANL